MKRYFTFTFAAVIAASISATAWSQAGQGGGGGRTAGAGAAGGGASATGAGGNAAGNQTGANAQGRFNFNGLGQTPFFSDQGARQQLGLNDNQFNQLNQAYQQSYQRFNQSRNAAGRSLPNNAAGQQEQQSNIQADANQQGLQNGQQAIQPNPQGAQNGQQQAQTGQQGAQSNPQGTQSVDSNDFDSTLNSTFTEPTARQRFTQLNLQYQGVGAFSDPSIQQQLNLDSRQQQNFQRMATEWQRDFASFQQRRQTPLTQQQFDDLRNKFMNRVNRVLTPEQQQQWTQIAGQPYEFPYSAYSTSAANPAKQQLPSQEQVAPSQSGTPATGINQLPQQRTLR